MRVISTTIPPDDDGPLEQPVTLRLADRTWRTSEVVTLVLVVILAAVVPVVYQQRQFREQQLALWENPPQLKGGVPRDSATAQRSHEPGVVVPGGGPVRTDGKIQVDIKGAVNWPTVATLDAGARVQDAIKAANGALDEADLDRLNLAEPLKDGQQLIVPFKGEPDRPSESGIVDNHDPNAPAPEDRLQINHATLEELETIPGLGPKLAQAIIDYRHLHGPFITLADLNDVPGIGPLKVKTIMQYATLD